MSSERHYELYGQRSTVIPKDQIKIRPITYQIEIRPATNANGRYQPASLNEVYTQIVPPIEQAIGGKTNVEVNRSNVGVKRSGHKSAHEFVIVVAATGKTKRDQNHLESTIERIKQQYPEWADSLNVVPRKERYTN